MRFVNAAKAFVVRHQTWAAFIAAFLVYSGCTLFYMGGALTNCSESLLTFPGDNTAGLIALFSMDAHDPWWGHSTTWSYPYGESLGQPTHVTAQTLFIPFWMLAKAFGPICAFNLLSYIGFVSAALIMFGFVRWLLKGRVFVAFIAGFAVAFTPYLQIKTGVHISYVFEGFFIAAIWLFLYFWQKPSKKTAFFAALGTAPFAYTDGYFILLGGVLMGALIVSSFIYDYLKKGRKVDAVLKERFKLAVLAAAVAVAFILPVLYVQFTASGAINSLLANSRDTISNEAQVYGARPQEYILPNAMNPLTSKIFGTYYERNNHGSNPGENVLSLSLVMLVLAAYFVVTVVIAAKHRRQIKIAKGAFDPTFLAFVFGAIFLVALVFSFPPKAGPVPLPSFFLIEATQLWRVLARLSVIVNIALVVLGSLGLALILDRIKGNGRRILICLGVLVLIFFEYLTFTPPRPVSGYEKVPKLYYWLHDQKQYHEIAEYPLYEFATSPFPVFYNTYQRIHGKKMLNGAVSEPNPYFARLAVRDLDEPQSVPGLRALGIDFIVIHSATFPGEIAGLKFIKDSPESIIKIDNEASHVWGYEVLPGVKAQYVVAPTEGFHAPIIDSAITETQKMGHEGVLRVRQLSGSQSAASVRVEAQVRAINPKGQIISVQQHGKEVWRGTVPSNELLTIEFMVNPKYDFHIQAVDPSTDATLLLPSLSVEE